MKYILSLMVLLLVVSLHAAEKKPNIVFILADDLGYGDVQCLNPKRGKIPTPNIDKLASQGMIFTDAHTSSAVCTPTRYGIMTGRYNWRTKLQAGVLYGYDKPLIPKDRLTVPALLKQHGYTTGCIGKWHLGMDIEEGNPSPVISNGPTTRGFDSYFGISASLDMPPFAFVENNRFTEPLTATKKWLRSGPSGEKFEAVDVLPTLASKAVEFVSTHAKAGQPFFLYLPLTSPHTPTVPSKDWQGKSEMGAYGDFVMQTDAALGEVLAAIDKAGVAGNTLVVMTSDNGCAKAVDIPKLQEKGHYPSADFRGSKSDIFEGGHRVPFIVRWPDRTRPGSVSAQTICLNDLMATCAELVGAKLPDNAGEDSFSFLPVLLGTDKTPVHETVVHHSINGSFAIRQGKWKLALCADSGGWSAPLPGSKEAEGLPKDQLYDLSIDAAESKNLHAERPEEVARLTKLLEEMIANGRSTPGMKQANDAEIKIRKTTPKAKAKDIKNADAAPVKHGFLATGNETFIVDTDGKTTWTYPHASRDGWVQENGNILLALSKSKTHPGGAVIELDRDGKVVFEFKGTQAEVNTIQPLADGKVLLTEAGNKPRILEVNREGKILVDIPIQAQTKDHHLQTRMTRKLANGNYLVPQLLDRVVREYDSSGKIIWEVKTPNMPFTAIRLADGHTLIGCTVGNLVIEVDAKGAEVWRLSNDDLPNKPISDACGVQRLANGNTVFTSYRTTKGQTKLIEVTREKKIVWTYSDDRKTGIHHFQILRADGKVDGKEVSR